MVIGNGMIATRFESYRMNDAFIIFASGVSNSGTASTADFSREAELIKTTIQQNPGKQFAYFSTCSIYDPSMGNSRYVAHKKAMEELVRSLTNNYTIFRVSNPVGTTGNPHTLLNYFINHILQQQELIVWKNASRNIIDIDNMYMVCRELLLDKAFAGQTINIANPINYSVAEILLAIEAHFGKKGVYTFIDKGDGPVIDTTLASEFFSKLNITFTPQYLPALLNKYYP